MPGDHRVAQLRRLINDLRSLARGEAAFAAVEPAANADGTWLAGELTPLIAKNVDDPQIEDITEGLVGGFIDDRQAELRTGGRTEPELAAYSALISLKIAETFGSLITELAAADRAGRH